MTESERATLQLAPGSRWKGPVVRNDGGTAVSVEIAPWATFLAITEQDGDFDSCPIPDALAVIRATGLDPEYTELVRLREAVRVAEAALTQLTRWRDDDMLVAPRQFSEEDLRLVEVFAQDRVEELRKLVNP